MTQLTNSSLFHDNGNKKRERENFQNFIFNEIDTRDHSAPISFYRSDFRGARLMRSYFLNNNFSNADFIDTYLYATTFEKSKFKSTEFYNSYVERSTFINLNFSACSLVRLIFDHAKFDQVKFLSNNIQESKFINSEIRDCIFTKTSIDEVCFENTQIVNVDLSPMTAINLYFDQCTFENVVIDADYLGSYFFKGEFFDRLKLRYRGRIFKLKIGETELLANLFRLMIEKERYYEAINHIVQKNLIDNKASLIFPVVKLSLDRLLKDKNVLKRTYQISKIFSLFEFYFNSGYIKLNDYYQLTNYIDRIDISELDINEKLDLVTNNERIKNLLKMSIIETSMFDNISDHDTLYLEITIDEEDKNEFEFLLNLLLAKWTNINQPENSVYFIIGRRQGSIVYEIVILSSLGFLLLNIFRKSLSLRKKTDVISGLKSQIAETVLKNINTEISRADFSKLGIKEQLEIVRFVNEIDNERLTEDKSVQRFLNIIKIMQGQPTALNE